MNHQPGDLCSIPKRPHRLFPAIYAARDRFNASCRWLSPGEIVMVIAVVDSIDHDRHNVNPIDVMLLTRNGLEWLVGWSFEELTGRVSVVAQHFGN